MSFILCVSYVRPSKHLYKLCFGRFWLVLVGAAAPDMYKWAYKLRIWTTFLANLKVVYILAMLLLLVSMMSRDQIRDGARRTKVSIFDTISSKTNFSCNRAKINNLIEVLNRKAVAIERKIRKKIEQNNISKIFFANLHFKDRGQKANRDRHADCSLYNQLFFLGTSILYFSYFLCGSVF